MLIQMIEDMGLNSDLIIDVLAVLTCFFVMAMFIFVMQLKGVFFPLIKSRLKKENMAIIDIGGIETPIITYPRGSKELKWENKGNMFSWNIPDGVEREFPNNSRYILASTKVGAAFNHYKVEELEAAEYLHSTGEALNISRAGEILARVRIMLSPKGQANTIDDRAKQLSDLMTAGVNKPMLYGVALGIIFIVVIGGYLIVTKGLEYKLCTEGMMASTTVVKTIVSTTTTTMTPM